MVSPVDLTASSSTSLVEVASISNIPNELLFRILGFLDLPSQVGSRGVDHRFKVISTELILRKVLLDKAKELVQKIPKVLTRIEALKQIAEIELKINANEGVESLEKTGELIFEAEFGHDKTFSEKDVGLMNKIIDWIASWFGIDTGRGNEFLMRQAIDAQ